MNYKCKFCKYKARSKGLMIQHIVQEHTDDIMVAQIDFKIVN